MMVTFGILALTMAQAPTAQADVAYDELMRGDNAAAIEQLRTDEALDERDPARLINLGIAYARRGDTERARTILQAAAESSQRAELELATGEWMDSRRLARKALTMLDDGRLQSSERVAAR